MNSNATRRLRRHVLGMVLVFAASASCAGSPVTRTGPPEIRERSAAVPVGLEKLRAAVIAAAQAARQGTAALPTPLGGVSVVELDKWQDDWAENDVDTGGYLDPYRKLAAAGRRRDLRLDDFAGGVGWTSEHQTLR